MNTAIPRVQGDQLVQSCTDAKVSPIKWHSTLPKISSRLPVHFRCGTCTPGGLPVRSHQCFGFWHTANPLCFREVFRWWPAHSKHTISINDCYEPGVPAILEAEAGRSWCKAGLGKSVRPYLKNKQKAKSLDTWLKW
jgi:hypothetical protein